MFLRKFEKPIPQMFQCRHSLSFLYFQTSKLCKKFLITEKIPTKLIIQQAKLFCIDVFKYRSTFFQHTMEDLFMDFKMHLHVNKNLVTKMFYVI